MSAHWISSAARKRIKSLIFLDQCPVQWTTTFYPCSFHMGIYLGALGVSFTLFFMLLLEPLWRLFPHGNIFRCIMGFLYFVFHVTPWAFVTGGIWWHFPLSIYFVWCHYSKSRETLIYFFSWPTKEKVCCEILMEPWQESLPTSQPLHVFYLPAKSEFRKPHLH